MTLRVGDADLEGARYLSLSGSDFGRTEALYQRLSDIVDRELDEGKRTVYVRKTPEKLALQHRVIKAVSSDRQVTMSIHTYPLIVQRIRELEESLNNSNGHLLRAFPRNEQNL